VTSLRLPPSRLQRCSFLALLAISLIGIPAARIHAQAPTHQPSSASSGETSTPIAEVPQKKQEIKDEDDEYRHSAAVQKLGHIFGLDAEHAATAFTLINFLILAIAVGYGLLKLLPRTFAARNTAIQKQLVDARTATEEASARLNSVEARLAKLDDQIAGMRHQAEEDAAKEAQRIRANVEEEKSKILAAAEAEIQAATTAARRDIQQFAAGLAIEQAARKLVVTAETDRLLVENFARHLTGDNGGQN
jgi:F-type H+-transporting ATPase subunit b